MARQRSLSITPTFSSDRSLLLSHIPSATVSTVEEAKDALAILEIFRDNAFQRRVKLDTNEEWSEFLESCVDSSRPNLINLESALKKCYAATYSMPPSPVAHNRSNSAGSQDGPLPLTV
mmetsp:Transcript_24512/g.28367  ORF Transcript_24512/g.28367 Transcript_24512/m.28367 type:complete len:119 (+) Transcript_24512:91-447(+)